MASETKLSTQELKWIKESRYTRLTDNKEALIYPMGAERYLSLVLAGLQKTQYNLLQDIQNKDLLVIPGYGNTAFLLAHAGAKSVIVYDKDPVTIAWVKAFKKYYFYRQYDAKGKPYASVGELLNALTAWYPPLIRLPKGLIKNALGWAILPKSLRKTYLFYMLSLVKEAISSKSQESFELDKKIDFFAGELEKVKQEVDTVYVPYLLGVSGGIEEVDEIIAFIKKALLLTPKGHLIVTPSLNKKEFHLAGQRYFTTTCYKSIKDIPAISLQVLCEDTHWFKTQGLCVFGLRTGQK